MSLLSSICLISWMAIWSTLMRCGLSTKTQNNFPLHQNLLNGQHLRIIWPRWEGNPKGLSGPLKGGVIIDYLSDRFNFTYEMVRVTENRLEPPENGKGWINYLWNHECELLVTGILPTSQRLKTLDLTLPWNYDIYALLIPTSNTSTNTNAVIKPFQWPIWLALGISIICVIFFLNCSLRLFLSKDKEGNASSYLYVFGNLVSQGGPCKSSRLSYRIVAGVWCLATFIFVQAYTSTLITFVVAPVSWPLAESIYDVADSKDINLLVKKAGSVDNFISNTNQTQQYKKLKARIENYPESRCILVSDCIKLITPGSRNAFVDVRSYQLDAIKEEFERTGKCSMQLAKEGFMGVPAVFALAKNSPYTGTISLGLIELLEIGLIDHWDLWFRPMPHQCLGNIKSGYSMKSSKTGEKHTPLSLGNLTSAFFILAIGLSLSFLSFLHEHLTFCLAARSSNARRIGKTKL